MVSKRTVLLLLHDSILGICTGSSVVSFVCELYMNEVKFNHILGGGGCLNEFKLI